MGNDPVMRLTRIINGIDKARTVPIKGISPWDVLDIADKLLGKYKNLRGTVSEELSQLREGELTSLDERYETHLFDYNKCIGGLCDTHVRFFT
jgi:hypothetical protein